MEESHGETELKLCKNQDEEECQKKDVFFFKNLYFIQYKCGFFTRTHFGLIDSPIMVIALALLSLSRRKRDEWMRRYKP